MKKGTSVIVGALLVILGAADAAVADGKGKASMQGMSGEERMEGQGPMHVAKGESPGKDQGMTAMGDQVFEGKVGPWDAEIRMVDVKAQIRKSKISEKIKAKMKHTHHLMVGLTDPRTKKQVNEGKGSVTVTGPDKKQARYDFMGMQGHYGMQGHFGADVALGKSGKYAFLVSIESGGKKGTAAFSYTVK